MSFPLMTDDENRVVIAGKFTCSGTGAGALAVRTGEVKSVSRTANGEYTVLLAKAYKKLVKFECSMTPFSTLIVQDVSLKTDNVAGATPSIVIQSLQYVPYELLYAVQSFGQVAHLAFDSTISTADASSLATLKALAKRLAEWAEGHGPSTALHLAADAAGLAVAAWASKPAAPADAAECIAVVNEIRSDYNTHVLSTVFHNCVANRHPAEAIPSALLAALRSYGTLAHKTRDPQGLITTAVASDEPTTIALCTALKTWHNAHLANAVVHLAADAANLVTTATPCADYAACYVLLNEAKADYNAHYADLTYHHATSNRGAITTADATDAASAHLLANAIRTRYNLDAVDGAQSESPSAITTPAALTEAEAYTLANAIKSRFNLDAKDGASSRLGDIISGTVYFEITCLE